MKIYFFFYVSPSTMSHWRNNNNTTDLPITEGEELRNTLHAMQENLQTTIQNSLCEITKAVYARYRYRDSVDPHDKDRDPERERVYAESEDGSTDVEDNPFAEEVHHERQIVASPNHDREDSRRRWDLS